MALVVSNARKSITFFGNCGVFSLYHWICKPFFSLSCCCQEAQSHILSSTLVIVEASGPHGCNITLPWSWFSILMIFLCSWFIQLFIAFYFRVRNVVSFLRSVVGWGGEIHERKKFMRLWDTLPLKCRGFLSGTNPGRRDEQRRALPARCSLAVQRYGRASGREDPLGTVYWGAFISDLLPKLPSSDPGMWVALSSLWGLNPFLGSGEKEWDL